MEIFSRGWLDGEMESRKSEEKYTRELTCFLFSLLGLFAIQTLGEDDVLCFAVTRDDDNDDKRQETTREVKNIK